jgi:hypothetical protein
MNSEITLQQKAICQKYEAPYLEVNLNMIVGVADNINGPTMPINGLRHPQTDTTSGWYIWAGEYSSRKDFFRSMHIKHLIESHQELIPYLALPPGWRFLIDPTQNYEDVWRDPSLLSTEG